MKPCDTKVRILDSAEQMFAHSGYSNTSMRSLAAAAGVNLASAIIILALKANFLRPSLKGGFFPP